MSATTEPKLHSTIYLASLAFMLAGCGSMYTYYGMNDAAQLKTNAWVTAMDDDTHARQAGVFYIKPGSRVIGLRSKDTSRAETVMILEVQPQETYQVDHQQASDPAWQITAKKNPAQLSYRWCDMKLSCKPFEPFQQCARRFCTASD